LHGLLAEARGSDNPGEVRNIGYTDIKLGDVCSRGSQLRPNIVWFGEEVQHVDYALHLIREASRLLVVGTSLSVFPAAGFLGEARNAREKIIITLDLDNPPRYFDWRRGKASEIVPALTAEWLASTPA
jgi:NAD-dependent deacetylase